MKVLFPSVCHALRRELQARGSLELGILDKRDLTVNKKGPKPPITIHA